MSKKTYEDRNRKEELIKAFEAQQRKRIFQQLPHDLTKKQKRRIKLKRRRKLTKEVKQFKLNIMEILRHEKKKQLSPLEGSEDLQSSKTTSSDKSTHWKDINNRGVRRDIPQK